jgi:hypothetical protein
MNCNECGSGRTPSNLRHYPDICLSTATRTTVCIIIGSPAEDLNLTSLAHEVNPVPIDCNVRWQVNSSDSGLNIVSFPGPNYALYIWTDWGEPRNVSSRICNLWVKILNCTNKQTNKQTPWSESASELYRPSDRRLSAKWLPTFADRGCHMVSVTDPYGRILRFLDRSRYFSIK